MTDQPAPGATTIVAHLVGDQATTTRIADALSETFDPDDIVTATFENADGSWTIEAYFTATPDERRVRDVVADAAGDAAARILAFGTVAQRDWVAASLAGLQPVDAGRFVVHGGHDRARVPGHRIGIEIEAALAFGTGHHGTTRGCLLALDRLLKTRRPRRVLDVGTGTGVLAIAAARALRRGVLGSDIDPQAVHVARDNARLNRAAPFIELFTAPGLGAGRFRQRGPYDLAFANILLPPLKRLAEPMARLLAPGAVVVLSGLLHAHANAALAAYRAQGLVLVRRIPLDEWVTLVLVRPLRPRPSAP